MHYETKISFFDVDGVIKDSLPAAYQATVEVFKHHGVQAPSEEEYLLEFDARHPVEHYNKRGINVADELIWQKWLEHFNQCDHPVFPEVPEVLHSLHNSGVKLYYVTFSRSEERVFHAFRKAKILSLFKGGIFGCANKDEYMIEVYEGLNIDPEYCAMVGPHVEGFFFIPAATVCPRIL